MKKRIGLSLIVTTSVAAALAGVKTERVDTLKTYELQGVQVTATRANKQTPMAVTNVNKAAIAQQNTGRDLPYLMSLTPSITLTSDAGNAIGYTTMRVRGTDLSRINITANGVPMNDSESAVVFWVNMGDFASSLQSIQIQRGVGTSTNGAGAFGGTVNLQTEDLGIKSYGALDLAGGSYGTHKETFRFGTGLLGKHWAFQGRLSNIGSDGYVDRASTQLNSYLLQGGYFDDHRMIKFITFNGTEKTYLAWYYSSRYQQQKYGRTYNPSGYIYTDQQGKSHYYDNQTDNYHQQHYQLFWTEKFGQQWNTQLALHYTKGQGYYEEFKDGRKLFEYGMDANKTRAKSNLIRRLQMDNDFYGAIVSANYTSGKKLNATIGGAWNKYIGNHFGNVVWVEKPVDAYLHMQQYYDNDARKTDFNIFAKATYQWMRGLSSYLDLQYRHVGITMEGPGKEMNWNTYQQIAYHVNDKHNFFNPKVGINYEWARHHRAYISYAIANREPVRNNYQHNIEGNLEMPKAERLNDLEVGYRYETSKLTLGANFYHMAYKDQFVQTGEIDQIGEAITKNLPNSYRMGIELEGAWQPLTWFRWDANLTLSRNRVKGMSLQLADKDKTTVTLPGEQPLAFSPDVIANNIFTFTWKGLQAGIITKFVGDQYITNTGFRTMRVKDENKQDAEASLILEKFTTTDIDLSYRFAWKAMGIKEITAGITLYNIFNKLYDNNAWASPQYQRDANGNVYAENTWGTLDDEAVGRAVSAPFNVMARLSINF